MKIENLDEIRNELVKILISADEERRRYQVDVYLYIDSDGNGELSEYVNVGGNSWLDDDHITLYRIKQSYDDVEDLYTSIEEICDAAGIPVDETVSRIAAEKDCDADEVGYFDVRDYVASNYHDAILADYRAWRDDSVYRDQADAIIEAFGASLEAE